MPENEPWEYSLYMPNDLRAVTVSRRTLRLILTMHGLIRLVDVAELLATELVSNAVRHTKRAPPPCACAGRPRGRCGSGPGTPIPNRPSRPGRSTPRPGTRTGGAWPSSGPVPTYGAGIRWPDTATGASTCGASWVPLRASG